MKSSRIRLSSRAQSVLGMLKSKTGLSTNVLARHALCLSLRDTTIPNSNIYDEHGMEIPLHTLFGKYDKIFEIVLRRRLSNDNLSFDEYSDKMLRAHINRGASMLFPRINDVDDFIKLVEED